MRMFAGTDHEVDVTKETARHKFNGDPMAEWLWFLSLESIQDRDSGSVEWFVWFAQFGKRLLYSNDQGAVWQNRFNTLDEANAEYEQLNAMYGQWLDDEDEEPVPDERAGPWKSFQGEYPAADEIYDLTHPQEPEEYDDWYDAHAPEHEPEDYEPNPYDGTYSED